MKAKSKEDKAKAKRTAGSQAVAISGEELRSRFMDVLQSAGKQAAIVVMDDNDPRYLKVVFVGPAKGCHNLALAVQYGLEGLFKLMVSFYRKRLRSEKEAGK